MELPFFTPLDQRIYESRIVQVSGAVSSNLAHQVNRQLLALEREAADQPIYLYVNSPGGEVTSGFAIFDTARFIQPEIITLVTGLAASMGSIIALAAEKKNRWALPNAKFLIHQPLISG
ncbi:MAG: ATP-dependent Clp protease proteolytic subunit, partial [Myxococcota bacterium]